MSLLPVFDFNPIYLLYIIPLVGMIVNTFFLSSSTGTSAKKVGLITCGLNLLTTLWIWLNFKPNFIGFQYFSTVEGFWTIHLGIDGISLFFIVLTAILTPVCIEVSNKQIKTQGGFYIFLYLFMLLLLNLVFTVLDLIGFYISFEAIVIPMFFIIGVWGSREEKVKAAYYFFLYTIGGSVLLLLSFLFLYYSYGTTDLLYLLKVTIKENWQYPIFLAFLLSFGAKIPLIPFHIWLPLAHVEAPVGGSVILAGLLIKLGAYGFIRFALPLTPIAAEYFSPLILTLSLISIIYASLTTIRQTDLKRIIAYSSVAHMGVVTLSIFTWTSVGIQASIFLQLAHGLVSSALFILVTILYEHHHTRLVKYYRGVVITMPIFVTIFALFTLCNIAVPLSPNFIGEFLGLLSAFGVSPIIGILAASSMVLSACYALFLMNRICFGAPSPYILKARDMSGNETYVMLLLITLTLLIGVFPNIIFSYISTSVHSLLVI